MIPTYHYSISSPMPIDLNEDHNPHFFSQHQAYSPSSSLTYPTFYNPDQDQPGSHYWESKPSQSNEEAEKSIPSGGSWDHSTEKVERNMKLTVWKKEERDEENQAEHNGSSKWMSSKMRIMQKIMISDHQTGSSNVAGSSAKKSEDQKQPLSPLGTDNSSKSCSYNSNITVRVCSDCHTTKTPLWRSGPRGPKSLCNACGIRQRKARRAMAAAAASANGTILAAEASPFAVKKLQNKEKKAKINGCSPQLKKKRKLGAKRISQEREKFGFEDFRISLSKKLAVQHVFPQDEKEAAILLMALSYGLVHG